MAFADVIRTDAVFPTSHLSLLFDPRFCRDLTTTIFSITVDSHLEFSSFLFREPQRQRRWERSKRWRWMERVVVERGTRGGIRWWRRSLGGRRVWMDPEGRECKILQPRGTHGDVISTTEPETYYNSHNPPTTKSLGFHVWMAHSPWFVSRKVYLFRLSLLLFAYFLSSYSSRVSSTDSRQASAWLLPVLFLLSTWIRGKQRFHFSLALWEQPKLRGGGNEKKSATFLALQISFIMTLIIYYADSIVPSLTYETQKTLWKIREGSWRQI